MPVSVKNSHLIYDALKACDIRLMSALPETWLVHLIRLADDDPDVILVRLAKEEEGVGISAGAPLAGGKSAMLMQNHGFLASINRIVSLAHLYKIPLLMLISYRGEFGERDPWQTQGGGVTEPLLHSLGMPVVVLDGDGSLLMNLGSLTPMARYRPRNLLHIVFDNASLLSVGGFPTATATGSDLAAIAAAAGVPRTRTVRDTEAFMAAVADALAAHELTTIVATVEATGPATFLTDLSLLENRFQFQRYLRAPGEQSAGAP